MASAGFVTSAAIEEPEIIVSDSITPTLESSQQERLIATLRPFALCTIDPPLCPLLADCGSLAMTPPLASSPHSSRPPECPQRGAERTFTAQAGPAAPAANQPFLKRSAGDPREPPALRESSLRAWYHFPHESFNPVTRLNTALPPTPCSTRSATKYPCRSNWNLSSGLAVASEGSTHA